MSKQRNESATLTPRSLSTTNAPATPVSCRMLRSPSHESVTTDLSLFSISSLCSEALALGRHHHRLLAGNKAGGGHGDSAGLRHNSGRPADIPEIMWFEEGNDLIRSCAALSSVLGIHKSFSTSDIAQLPARESSPPLNNQLCHAVSELALNSLQRCGYLLDHPRLEHASRSCSTWVAVGEFLSTSQLPSPHDGQTSVPSICTSTPPPPPTFTAVDLIRSVNKKVRQNYIRRRLLTTYRALERLSQSEFNLDRLEAVAAAATASQGPGPIELVVPQVVHTASVIIAPSSPVIVMPSTADDQPPQTDTNVVASGDNIKSVTSGNQPLQQSQSSSLKKKITINLTKNLTMIDIERERGMPLSKYERNMMIFNWLHSLDENSTVEDTIQ